jgi:RNA polymerase sigma-70 factor (ECF subfamily)
MGDRSALPSFSDARTPAFSTTHWSVVVAAAHSSAPGARDALEKLCATYWYPLYAYVRRRGYRPHDAEDLTQAFFEWLLQSDHLDVADPQRGRFRSFLLVRLKHFLSDEWKRSRAQKRGGGRTPISLDAQSAEARYAIEPVTELTAEQVFERRWALAMLEQTVARLREEYVTAGRTELFDELKHFPPGEKGDRPYAEAATRLGLTPSAVKSAIHRMRKRHRDLLREQIAHTVSTPGEVDEELRYLIKVMGGG